MTVTVNGEQWELPAHATLVDVLERFGSPAGGIAIGLDGAVVPRASWPGMALRDGAQIDVVTAVQGG